MAGPLGRVCEIRKFLTPLRRDFVFAEVLPGLDGTAQIALATAIDLADSALPRKIDDHVALTRMETDPGQETDKPPIVAA